MDAVLLKYNDSRNYMYNLSICEPNAVEIKLIIVKRNSNKLKTDESKSENLQTKIGDKKSDENEKYDKTLHAMETTPHVEKKVRENKILLATK